MAKGGARRTNREAMRKRQSELSFREKSFQQAVALHQSGRLLDADSAYRQVLAEVPDHADALHLMGVIQCQQGQYQAGADFIARAIAVTPNMPAFHYNLGLALQHLKRFEEALGSFDVALALKPDYVQALNNRGVALQNLRRPEDALVSFDRALALKPNYLETLTNRGIALHALKRPEEALASFDRALALKPDHLEALNNRGKALQDLNRPMQALRCFERAVELDPQFAAANWNEALCRLLTADFENGWKKFEWRWHAEQLQTLRRSFSQPLWNGNQSLSGKTILLHAEQGFGDTIQFCRFAKLVAAQGGTVLLEVQQPLKSLLAGLEGVAKIFARGEELPSFDYHCPLLSLPRAFNTTIQSIPTDIPYLSAAPHLVEQWKARLPATTLPRIGIAWSGSLTHTNDSNRSIPLQEFGNLLSEHVHFVALQKDLRPADQAALNARKGLLHFGHELTDFSDTSALVELMDVVISVDTSVAHLAGAMGKPVWILLPFAPDWRWLLQRDDSPWYHSAKLFRQPQISDWKSVIERVKNELRGLP